MKLKVDVKRTDNISLTSSENRPYSRTERMAMVARDLKWPRQPVARQVHHSSSAWPEQQGIAAATAQNAKLKKHAVVRQEERWLSLKERQCTSRKWPSEAARTVS